MTTRQASAPPTIPSGAQTFGRIDCAGPCRLGPEFIRALAPGEPLAPTRR